MPIIVPINPLKNLKLFSLFSFECFISDHTLPKRWASTYLRNPEGLQVGLSDAGRSVGSLDGLRRGGIYCL